MTEKKIKFTAVLHGKSPVQPMPKLSGCPIGQITSSSLLKTERGLIADQAAITMY
jgi:hypothetical protein